MKSLNLKAVEREFFKGKNPLKKLLSISLDLFGARQSGLLYGTNETRIRFLPSSQWDRGVMDRFDGKGIKGLVLRLAGTRIVNLRGLSPVYFYKAGPDGSQEDNHGIISYVLRNSADYYRNGINVVICPDTDRFQHLEDGTDAYQPIRFYVYNGSEISKPRSHIKVDIRIVRHFRSSNSIYVILPDYGIMVINTADPELVAVRNGTFLKEAELRQRLDILIRMVAASSLAYLGQLRGRAGGELLWRKEAHLRKAYADLAEKEKKYRRLYTHAPIAYFSIHPDGRIVRANQQTLHLSGYDFDDLVGRPVRDLFPRESPQFDAIWRTLETGCSIREEEIRIQRRDHQRVWVSLSIDAAGSGEGEGREMRATATDISQRKSLEKQLFHAQKMEAIGTLSRGIAHDFNNILSPISGYAQILLMDKGRDAREREYIQTILACARHAGNLVNQILTFSRQKEHQRILVKAAKIVETSMGLVKSFLPAFIRIQTRVEPGCGYIMADPTQIHQVIMNLATNSCHAMEETGGVLDICLDRKMMVPGNTENIAPGDYVCLCVSDTGTGIDTEHLSRIFDPYFTTKPEGKGSGIGLSVVHGIVESHGGKIRVKSDPGQGTCFKIYFPVCRQGNTSPAEPAPDQFVTRGNESILLVERRCKGGGNAYPAP